MKTKINKLIALFLVALLPGTFTLQSCDDNTIPDLIDTLFSIIDQTGWIQRDEQMNNIPEDITPFDDETATLKTVVLLEDKFPPIGNQGSFGTCVAWAVGYNLKTALNAIEKGWTSSQLASTANQTSPKDLWLTIPDNNKGEKCQGTNFEPALDALISDGAASLGSVPYSMGSCTGTKTGNGQNKLANYRKIADKEASGNSGLTVDNFKGYLNAGRPIAFGAQLGDRFMNWNSSAVISSDTYNNPGMLHAYHAMALVGYDDSKSAFRVRNSWGTSWGDNGSIWVDYDFFCKNFCFAAFVAQNVNSISAGSGEIATGDRSNGDDLLAYSAEDNESNDPDFNREFTYDVYNSGNKTIYPSQDWSVVYMYYNATDAKDYEIIFEDMYTDDYGADDGFVDIPWALSGGWYNNVSVEPGKKAGEAEYEDAGFVISYNMPKITGKYYLVVMADAYDVIPEVNEDNNFYFITAENGKPLEFKDGEILNMSKSQAISRMSNKHKRPALYSNTDTQTPVQVGNLNAYTPSEIKTMLIHDKKTKKLDAKIKKFRTNSTDKQIKRKKIQ